MDDTWGLAHEFFSQTRAIFSKQHVLGYMLLPLVWQRVEIGSFAHSLLSATHSQSQYLYLVAFLESLNEWCHLNLTRMHQMRF